MTLTRQAPQTPSKSTTGASPRSKSAGDLRAFGVWLWVLGGALLLNSAAGPLGWNIVDYPISPTMTNQLIGLEVVTTLLVVPGMALAGALALRGNRLAPLVAFGPTAYTAYMFIQYVLGPEYDAYSLIVVAHLAITATAGALTLAAWTLAKDAPLPAPTPGARRRQSALLMALAAFVLLRYIPALAGSITNEPLTAEFADARTFYWSIFFLDLGVVVPATVIAALSVLRGHLAGTRGVYAVLGWFALTPPSVASMAAVMLVRGDPHASWPTFALLTAAAVFFLAAAISMFVRLFRTAPAPS